MLRTVEKMSGAGPTNDIVDGSFRPRMAEAVAAAVMTVVHTGDLIYLERSPDESGSSGGVVHGDTNLRQLGVATPSRNGMKGSWRFNECVFRVCTRLIYFAKNELKPLELLLEKREQAKVETLEAGIAQTAASLREDDRFMSDLLLARERAEIERVQNKHALQNLDEGKTESVNYGDVIQLQHLPSGFFVTLQHTAATVDIRCRKVALEPEGSSLTKFRILPRYRGQTMGSPVTAGSGIILQNVEVSSLTLAVGSGPNMRRPPAHFIRAEPRPDIGMRLPHVLNHGPIVELNASIERRGGFTIRIFKCHSHSASGDESHRNSMFTSLHKFRLFHPESEGSVLASTNTDKGEVLDFVEGIEDGNVRATLSRNDGTPAHIPYVKLLKTGLAQSGEDDGDIKGVWSFELINRSTSGPVMWRSPLRIRHVSGKYLSVNSKTQANIQASDRSSAGAGSASEVMKFFDVALVTDVDLNAEPGTFGSPDSLVFSIVPQNPQAQNSVPNAVSPVIIEHLPPWGEESRALHFFVSSESKPQFTWKPEEIASEEDCWNGSIGPRRKHGLRILFCTHRSPDDTLRIYPLMKENSMQLDQILSQIPLLKLYAYLYQSEGTLSKCVVLAEPLCASLLRLLESLHKKDEGEVWSPLLAAKSTLEYMKNANSRQYIDLCASYMGEQTSDTQVLIFQTKLLNCIFDATLAPYNRCKQNTRAFNDRVASDLPRALQIVLNISLQCASHGNERVHKYFSTRMSRAWFAISPEDSDRKELSRSVVPENNFRSRRFQPWHDLLVHMCEDELGSANILTDLIRSSGTFSSKVYSKSYIRFIKVSIGRFGPQRRLLDIISALCYVDGLPSVERQEMCIQEIITDPYAFGFSFHEYKKSFIPRVRLKSGGSVRVGVESDFQEGENRFLGDTEANTYAPVCVAWSSQQNWTRGCGKLWWSAERLGLPIVDRIEVNDIKDNKFLEFTASPPPDRNTAASSFAKTVPVLNYGVLGQAVTATGAFVIRAPDPTAAVPGTVIVDPAGLHHIQPPGGPRNAHGAAGAIYKFVGIASHEQFPPDVVAAITKTSHAKYHKYTKPSTDSAAKGVEEVAEEAVHVIHAVGPDLRTAFCGGALSEEGAGFTRAQAVAALAEAYKNVLTEFVASGQPSLRLLPLSGGIFAGKFLGEIPAVTLEALEKGFQLVPPAHQAALRAKQEEARSGGGGGVGMCVLADSDLAAFFDAGFPQPFTPSAADTRSLGLEGTAGIFGLVPIEHLLWPLDPEVLCPRVLRKQFQPEEFGFGKTDTKERKTKKMPLFNGSFNVKKESNYMYTADEDVVNIRKRFEAHFTLAEFMVAQMNLMATLCESRSSLNFFHTERFFSYDVLMNMATNEKLPSVFRSSVLRLVNALYLDRYPQLPASGAPHFPGELWVFAEDQYSGPRKSTIPIIQKMTPGQNGAFPKFALSPLSINHNSPNPVESHPDDRKFLLLANLCEELIFKSTSNGVIHSEIRLNTLALVALQTQSCLLNFGFMGAFQKLKQVAHTCASVLDGRTDVMLPGIPFESHEQRYQQGSRSKVPNDMKKCVIETLLHIVDVRTNFRLGKLLYLFKEKAIAHAQHNTALDLEARAAKGGAMVSNDHGSAMKYLTGVRSQELFEDFDALFTTDEAADLDLAKLANMKNLDHVIMDCLMNHDDDLLASGLQLLFSTYGQRRQIGQSLAEVVLLVSPALPVFDDVHTLLTEAQDLMSLLKSYSAWGVTSVISGPFGDDEFAKAMVTVERMLQFLHDFDTFKKVIRMQPYSILGTRMGLDKKVIEGAGPDPGDVPGCAIVDPAGLKYIQPFGGGPCKVSGASKSIHRWIGTDKDRSFHPEIIQAIKKPGDAIYHMYQRRDQSDVHVIHAVGPDFRRKHEPAMPAYTRDEGVELLCQAYHSILVEFVASGQNVLRLTPVSGGAQAGPFVYEIAELAEEGMRGGFARLTASQQAHVLEKQVHLCIFAEKELKAFFNAGFIPSPEAAKLIAVSEVKKPHSSGSTGFLQKSKSLAAFSCKKRTKAQKNEHLWSLDVASKWTRNKFARLPVMGKFQDILRALNVQGIITATLLGKQRMDPRIAWKGSVCTENERVESERRLVMLSSALLSLAIKFVTDNRENQRILALSFHDLQNLAARKESSVDILADKTKNEIKSTLSSNASDKGITGYKTISELAQELILAILRGNEPLVESYVGPELLYLFVNLVNQSVDVSASHAIDLFFVLAKPETQPLKAQQTAIVREILRSGLLSPFVNGLRRCLREVARSTEWGGGSLAIPLQNPARLVQLVFALIEGGNGDAWLELAMHAGVTLDDACDATVNFLEKFMAKAGYDGPSRLPPPYQVEESKGSGPAKLWNPVTAAGNDSIKRNFAVSQLLESGTGKVLCGLLAEAVLIVPHTEVTLRSKSLWRFIEEAAVPVVIHFISKEHPTALEIGLVTGMIELLQHVLSELALAGLLEDAIIDHPYAVNLLGMACEGIMEGRTSFYKELRVKFSETIKNRVTTEDGAVIRSSKVRAVSPMPPDKSSGKLLDGGLSRDEFRSIMNILAHQGGTEVDDLSNTPHLFCQGALPGINYFDEAKIGEAFDAADRDNNDSIGHEEFVHLFEIIIEGALGFGGARVHNYHRISKRSVECVERIKLICAKDYADLKDLKEPRARTSDDGNKSGKIKFNFRKRTEKKHDGHHLSSNLEDQFTAFKKAVRVMPQLKNKIDERRFSMVSVLENGAPLLGSVDGKPVKGEHRIALGGRAHRRGSKEAKKLMLETSLQISWEDLTSRLVKYAKGHFKDEGTGADTCGFIFSVWAYHLMKAHDMSREVSAAGFASDPKKLVRAKQAYEEKQESLDDSGVTDLLAKIIVTLPVGEAGSVQDKAINLFSELLKGGNEQIQRSLYSYLDKKDTEGKFLRHLFERLDHSLVGLQGCKERGLLGLNMTPESAEYVDNADQILEFLQLLCENHNPKFQNLLREQPQAPTQVNLVQKAMDFLNLLVDSTATVADFSQSEHRLASQILAFLTECMEGPCSRNQVRITTVEVINSVNAILSVNPNQKMEFASAEISDASSAGKARALAGMVSIDGEDEDAPEDLRESACVMLAACLEGRHDTLTHDSMRRRIDQRMLGRYRCELEEGISATVLAAEVEYRLLDKAEENVVASMQTALAALATVASELHLTLPVESAKDVFENERELSKKNVKPLDEKEDTWEAQRGRRGSVWGSDMVAGAIVAVAKAVEGINVNGVEGSCDESPSDEEEEGAPSGSGAGAGGGGEKVGGEGGIGSGLLGTCEIAWQGKIERTVFPLPIEFKYLAPQTKEVFMKEVPVDTEDTRMAELIKQSIVFEAEMRLVHKKSVESRVYQFLTNHLSDIKSLMYVFVILLNLNVLMSPATLSSPLEALSRHYGWLQYDGDDRRRLAKKTSKSASSPSNSRGAGSAGSGQRHNGLSSLEVYSLLLTLALGLFIFTGYFFIMNHVGRTEVPILIKEYEENVTQNRLALKPSEWINLRPYKILAAAFFFNIMFCVIHSANFNPIPELYIFVFCFVTLPWTLVATRKSILVPCGPLKNLQRVYCLAYDIILSRPIFRNHVILQCFSILGFYRSQFFTIMLLGVVNINPTLAGIIKSITAPGFSLIMVFYLFLITVIIYASFGQQSFGEYLLVPEWDDENGPSESPCTSTLSCLYAIFYAQLAGSLGELKDHLRTVDPQSEDYYSRILYDSVFFIWVGLVLTNIITGLMVDTFSAIRSEEASRLEVLETECFVCGVTRAVYDNYNIGKKGATFKQHQNEDHNPWIYVAYLAYLRQKDETCHNGIETFVYACVEQRSMDWIPAGTSAAIEAHKKAAARAARRQLTLQAYDDDDDDDDKNGVASY